MQLYKECDKCKSWIGVKDACDVCDDKPNKFKKYNRSVKGKERSKKAYEKQKSNDTVRITVPRHLASAVRELINP